MGCQEDNALTYVRTESRYSRVQNATGKHSGRVVAGWTFARGVDARQGNPGVSPAVTGVAEREADVLPMD
jgi:hypothetical protein